MVMATKPTKIRKNKCISAVFKLIKHYWMVSCDYISVIFKTYNYNMTIYISRFSCNGNIEQCDDN